MEHTIYNIVMPDVAQTQAEIMRLINKNGFRYGTHSEFIYIPESEIAAMKAFSSKICPELGSLFTFMIQTSWKLLDDSLIVEIVENWLRVQEPFDPDVTKSLSWLLLLLQHRRKDEEYKKISSLVGRYLLTDKRKLKFSRRMLGLIDNPDKKIGVLRLVRDEEISLIDTAINTATPLSRDELIHSDASGLYYDTLEAANVYAYEGTLTDEDQERKYQNFTIESVIFEHGVPRLESDQHYGEEDKKTVALYTEQLKILKKKEQEEGLNEDEHKQKLFYQHHVYNGKSRYDFPESDNAAANLRSGLNNYYKGLMKKIPTPKFGQDFIKESLKLGRSCVWKQQGIANKWLGIGRDGKDLPPRILNADDMNRALGAWLSKERWARLPEAHLKELNLVELTMMRSLYETGRQSRQQSGYLPLNVTYQKYADACRCDWQVKDLGGKTNLLEMLEIGLRHFGIIG